MSSFADLVKGQKQQTVTENPVQEKALSGTDKLKNKLAEKKGGGFKLNVKKPSTPVAATPPSPKETTAPKPTSAVAVPPSPEEPIEVGSAAATVTADDFVHPEQPEKFEEQQVIAFKKALQLMRESLEHPETVIQMMRKVLTMIEEEKNLVEFLLPTDGQLMTRTLRASYGIEIAKKDKRSANKEAKAKEVNEVVDLLDGIEGFG